jgi:hypothetical protein
MRSLARWAPLLASLAIGLALGLVYTWVVNPVEITNTYPALLRTDYRWSWVRMAALSYVAEGDLGRAQARLAGIEHEDVAGALSALIEEYAAAGRPADTLRSLSTLAETLGVHTPAMWAYLQTPAPTLAPTRTPTPLPSGEAPTSTPHTPAPPPPTPEPTPTPTPTPLPIPAFQLAGQELICEPGVSPHVEVVVQDEEGNGLAGVEIWLAWPGGADRAVTGLKPQEGEGYADFDAAPGVSYDLSTSALGMPLVTGLLSKSCPAQEGEQPMLGSWRIVLVLRPPADEPPAGTSQP